MDAETLEKLAFICVKCHKPVSGAIQYGTKWMGYQFLVRCHGAQATVTVPTDDIAKAHGLLKVDCFIDKKNKWGEPVQPQGKTMGEGPKPRLRFYCNECDETSGEFNWQRDPAHATTVFIVTCCGDRCQGRQYPVTIKNDALAKANVYDQRQPPILLPIQDGIGQKPRDLGFNPNPPPAPPARPPNPKPIPAMRKLRIEDDGL